MMIGFDSPSRAIRRFELYVPNPNQVIVPAKIVCIGKGYIALCKKTGKVFVPDRIKNAHYLISGRKQWTDAIFSALVKLKIITKADRDLHFKAQELQAQIQSLRFRKEYYTKLAEEAPVEIDALALKALDNQISILLAERDALWEPDI